MSFTNYRALRNSTTFQNFNNFFSKNQIFVDKYVNQITLRDFTIATQVPYDGWKQLTIIKGDIQQEVVRIFFVNAHNPNFT